MRVGGAAAPSKKGPFAVRQEIYLCHETEHHHVSDDIRTFEKVSRIDIAFVNYIHSLKSNICQIYI